MKNIFIIILLALNLQSCLPAIFTVAGTTAVAAAKDQPLSETMHDAKIASLIKAALYRENFKDLGVKITVKVSQGRVLYTGNITREEDALKAVEIAWNQPHVTEVINELKVDQNSSNFNLVQYTKDSMITGQIKAKSLVDKDIKFSNYTVVTINNIVYLFGIARSEEELEKVADIASKIMGVEKVTSYAKVLNNNVNEF